MGRGRLFLIQHLDFDVFELERHGVAAVHLDTDDAVLAGFGAVVRHLCGDLAVDAVGDVVAVGDDHCLVPFADGFDFGGDFGVRFFEGRVGALVFGIPDGFFAAVAHDATATGATAFVVDDSGVGIVSVDVSLIAADVKHLGVINFTTDLHAGISAGGDPFETVADFEVGELLGVVFRA